VRLIYPKLDPLPDLGFTRIAGAGLGNCFFAYFHAFVLARKWDATLIHPAWPSFKLGPLLRGENSKRFYVGIFHAPPDEMAGMRKMIALARYRRGAPVVDAAEIDQATPRDGMTLVTSRAFVFAGLQAWRAEVRARFLQMIVEPPPPGFRWGAGDYAALHVRLGDFGSPDTQATAYSSNTRISLDWYKAVIRLVQRERPGLPIRILSDGKDEELAPLSALGAQVTRTGSDIGDLLMLSGASLLIGSNSTYSRWAAYLGDMETIWTPVTRKVEKPSSAGARIHFPTADAISLS
jgi:hypothetical protein